MLALGFAAFFCFGLLLVLPGANQDAIARDLTLDLSRTGLLAAALAGGIGVGVVAAGPLFDRYSRRTLFVAVTALAGAALLAIGAVRSFAATAALLALIGAAAGAYDTLFNAAVVERFGARAAKPMAILHAAATLGAMAGPPLYAWVGEQWGWRVGVQCVGFAHLLLAASAWFVSFPAPPARREASAGPRERVLSWALAPFAVVAFAYVGVESALTVFAIPYATGGLALDAARGLASISAFWFGLLAGRLAPLLLRGNLDARLLVACGVLGSAAIGAGIALSSAHVELLFGCVGFALGPVYPLMIAMAGHRFPDSRGTAAGLAAGAGGLGGFAIPWLTGALGDGFGIEAALGSMALWAAIIALGGVAARRGGRPATLA